MSMMPGDEPTTGSFYVFLHKETVHWCGVDGTKQLRFGCLISKELKQCLGLGGD